MRRLAILLALPFLCSCIVQTDPLKGPPGDAGIPGPEGDAGPQGPPWTCAADAGCVCEPASTATCYTGPPGTDGIGICHPGIHVCKADGSAFGDCLLEVTPAPNEDCGTVADDNCDGQINEAPCACVPGTASSCYAGPVATEGVGICRSGVHVCNLDGMGFGQCSGEVTPAVEDCSDPAFLDEDCNGVSCSKPLWWKSFGDGAGQVGTRVAVDTQGNEVLVGYFDGEINLCPTLSNNGSGIDIFVAKFDPTGTCLWSKSFGDFSAACDANDVAIDAAGDVVLTGTIKGMVDFGCGSLPAGASHDAYVAKLKGSDGSCIWAKDYGDGAYQTGRSVAVDPNNGDIIVSIELQGSADIGCGAIASNGGSDVMLARLSGITGACLWSKDFGDAGQQWGNEVAIDAAGNVLVTGPFTGTINFDPSDASQIRTSTGGSDLFVTKLNAAGNHVWSRSFGSIGNDNGTTVASDAFNHVIVSGFFQNTVDFGGGPVASAGDKDIFLVMYDSSGAYVWGHRFGDILPDVGGDVAIDPSGYIILTGYFNGTADFGGGSLTSTLGSTDGFVAKFSSSGAHAWSKRFGDGGNQYGDGVAVDSSGNVIVTGYFTGSVDFGLGALPNASSNDVFFVKFAP